MNDVKNYETAIDWLTMTTTSSKMGSIYQAIFLSYADLHREAWHFHGYEGEKTCNGEMSYGQSNKDGRHIIVARGGIADEIFITRPPRPAQLSRLDVQTTVQFAHPRPDLLEEIYEGVSGAVKKKTRIINSEGGETVYVGSRHSQLFVRVYDAGVRHSLGERATIFRYEIEVKKPVALALADVLWGSKDVKEMRLNMADFEATILNKRGIIPPWEQGIVEMSWRSLVHREKLQDQTFIWLAGQVASAVEKMLEKGYTREELEAVLFPLARPDPEF